MEEKQIIIEEAVKSLRLNDVQAEYLRSVFNTIYIMGEISGAVEIQKTVDQVLGGTTV